jgi:hypothetical protein
MKGVAVLLKTSVEPRYPKLLVMAESSSKVLKVLNFALFGVYFLKELILIFKCFYCLICVFFQTGHNIF